MHQQKTVQHWPTYDKAAYFAVFSFRLCFYNLLAKPSLLETQQNVVQLTLFSARCQSRFDKREFVLSADWR